MNLSSLQQVNKSTLEKLAAMVHEEKQNTSHCD